MEEEREDSRAASMDPPAPVPERSAALTMEEPPEAFPLAGSRVLVAEVFTVAEAFMEAAVAAANSVRFATDEIDDLEKKLCARRI